LPLVEVEEVHTVLASSSPFGPVTNGQVTLRGKACTGSVLFRPDKPHCSCCDEIDCYEFDIYLDGVKSTPNKADSDTSSDETQKGEYEDGNEEGKENEKEEETKEENHNGDKNDDDATNSSKAQLNDDPKTETPTSPQEDTPPSPSQQPEPIQQPQQNLAIRIYPDITWQGLPTNSTETDLLFIPLLKDVFGYEVPRYDGDWKEVGTERKWCTWVTGLVLKEVDGAVDDPAFEGGEEGRLRQAKKTFSRWGTWKVSVMHSKGDDLGGLEDAFENFDQGVGKTYDSRRRGESKINWGQDGEGTVTYSFQIN
jgi:hypothetical protein